MRPFLDQNLPQERSRRWKQAIERILTKVNQAEHTVLCFHNIFYRDRNFFSCVDWDLLTSFQPTIFITLINDVYDVWETINARERNMATNSHLRLPEILAWRSAEICATQTLAENIYVHPSLGQLDVDEFARLRQQFPRVATVFGAPVPHFVFAVKHPASTLYNLLFRRDSLPVYASFPISKTRNDLEGRAEIDAYRQALTDCDFLTVFDPLTIDELRLSKDAHGKPCVTHRWPLGARGPMAAEVELTTDPFEGYSEAEFASFKDSIEAHIVRRDYQLVSQARVVAAYRPFYGGPLGRGVPPSPHPSGGVEKELMYGMNLSKLVYAVHPSEDREFGVDVFGSMRFAVQPLKTEKLLEIFQHHQKLRYDTMKQDGEAATWELNGRGERL